MAQTFFIIIIGIVVLNFAFERFLDYLNTTRWSDILPEELSGIYDPTEYKKSQQYLKANHNFSMITDSFSFMVMLAMLIFGGFAIIDQWVRGITENPMWIAILFFGVIGLASDIISTPFAIYDT
jgi:STE24 endopeptidase